MLTFILKSPRPMNTMVSSRAFLRPLTLSSSHQVKEIIEKETVGPKGKPEIVIEGVIKESSRKSRLINPSLVSKRCQAKENCHPLCQLNFVNEIKHTGNNV